MPRPKRPSTQAAGKRKPKQPQGSPPRPTQDELFRNEALSNPPSVLVELRPAKRVKFNLSAAEPAAVVSSNSSSSKNTYTAADAAEALQHMNEFCDRSAAAAATEAADNQHPDEAPVSPEPIADSPPVGPASPMESVPSPASSDNGGDQSCHNLQVANEVTVENVADHDRNVSQILPIPHSPAIGSRTSGKNDNDDDDEDDNGNEHAGGQEEMDTGGVEAEAAAAHQSPSSPTLHTGIEDDAGAGHEGGSDDEDGSSEAEADDAKSESEDESAADEDADEDADGYVDTPDEHIFIKAPVPPIDPDTWTDIFKRAYESPKGCERSPSFVPESEWEHYVHELPTFQYVLEREKYGEQLSRLIKKLSRVYEKEEWYAGLLVESEEMKYTEEELLDSDHFKKLEESGKITYLFQKFKGVKGQGMVQIKKDGKEYELKKGEHWRTIMNRQKEKVAKMRAELLALKDSPLKQISKARLPRAFHELFCLVSYAAFQDKTFQGIYAHLTPEVVEHPPKDHGLICLMRVMEEVFSLDSHTAITVPEWLFSTACSFFALHREDYLMGSVNTVHWTDGDRGKKLWIVVAPKDAPVLQEVVKKLMEAGKLKCECDLYAIGSFHKQALLLVVEELIMRGVHVYYAMQGAGQTMILSPATPHMGGQLGANIASAVNFADLDLFTKVVLDRKVFKQCPHDKRAEARNENHGFDDVQTPQNVEAVRRATVEKLRANGNPEFPTLEDMPHVVTDDHFLTQEEFERVSTEKVVPDILREKFFTTDTFLHSQINSLPGIPGVRLPDMINAVKLAETLRNRREVGENEPKWELVGHIETDLRTDREIMAAIKSRRLKIDLLKGVQRYHVGRILRREKFLMTLYKNCSRQQIQQIITHEWAKEAYEHLPRLGLEALEIIRDIFQRTVDDHCLKNQLQASDRPPVFYSILTKPQEKDKVVSEPFAKDLKEKFAEMFPCLRKDILPLQVETRTADSAQRVFRTLCDMAQLPDDSMVLVRRLFARLADRKFVTSRQVREASSENYPGFLALLCRRRNSPCCFIQNPSPIPTVSCLTASMRQSNASYETKTSERFVGPVISLTWQRKRWA
ncbi:uncharacterized protein LOC129601892 isoform X1 [Paramacrobiotus metropolitanus]|uniref:uncharacterized protein LOC129601892 isoform X1 n=1 Tax=Paramacrobiotus metropolitanus TaxID=2943436 RepID=UPI002445ADEF|nr:uncharacterized protein LOC129601892 isoform X1 [Paramacrobiotus metropolitanus]XP_055356794.1 uncharacterized protein LOC129601892 isoform X1 [Paramacrobiotus metropolitanus]